MSLPAELELQELEEEIRTFIRNAKAHRKFWKALAVCCLAALEIKQKEAALQKELEQKTAKGGALGPAGPGSADEAAADRRVKMLEEQMVTNAREFSGQMSELKMKIMEMEMGMDDDDF